MTSAAIGCRVSTPAALEARRLPLARNLKLTDMMETLPDVIAMPNPAGAELLSAPGARTAPAKLGQPQHLRRPRRRVAARQEPHCTFQRHQIVSASFQCPANELTALLSDGDIGGDRLPGGVRPPLRPFDYRSHGFLAMMETLPDVIAMPNPPGKGPSPFGS